MSAALEWVGRTAEEHLGRTADAGTAGCDLVERPGAGWGVLDTGHGGRPTGRGAFIAARRRAYGQSVWTRPR